MKADLPKREPAMLEQWEKEKVYEKALLRRKGKEKFILHDGPPYANGHLHLGHALNKILKDIIVRYKTMAGLDAPYVPGWDCHGLPIELALMKEQKIDKSQIDRKKFRADAAAYASKFVEIQKEEFKRMGVLGDWDHPYLTMDESYKKTITDVFETLKKEGYIFRGKKPVHWCYTDETALAEAELEYENDKGPSIFVAFPAVQDETLSYVIWTTTPWTLPANLAIAFNPQERYAIYKNKKDNRKISSRRETGGKLSEINRPGLRLCAGSRRLCPCGFESPSSLGWPPGAASSSRFCRDGYWDGPRPYCPGAWA